MTVPELLAAVLDERLRQERIYGPQAGVLSPMEWASVLAQEGAELMEQLAGAVKRVQQAAANEQGYRLKPPTDLRLEAIQTAATAIRVAEFAKRLEDHPAVPIFKDLAS
jgi:hypothetical protein